MTFAARTDRRLTPRLLLLALTATSLLTTAGAADLPRRKPGLWEINSRMQGMPGIGAMQQCIDQHSDDLMQQQASKEKHNCSVLDVRTQGNKVTVHSVCQLQGTEATTDAVFVGTFDSAYKGEMQTRFKPPMNGVSESKATIDARWIGPCKPGQKAGDVIMPNMGGINLNEMMNDPRVQEMMKRQR
ncbi:DUF3617 family protein [Accumulibacter sp.]|uniref:DUF3617 domain-containing protein n=1 Tax=Accumulibacter sp. TaxID=2053492 RepID=UPI00262BC09F|nr:DUF3617 family protein [Accumulibacter sp.]